jgi:trans-aconitate methyltransferase
MSNKIIEVRSMKQLYSQLSELMGGMLPSNVVPAQGSRMLDIGWGMGESVYELALKYPTLNITGIDRDESVVEQAQSLVRGLNNVAVFVHDIHYFEDHVLSSAPFNLLHLHFLAGEITLQQFPPFLQSLARACHPGGLLVWTEVELPITTSLACQRLCSLVLRGLQARGHVFSQGNSLGLTARMGSMLSDAGYKCTQSKAYAIDISARSKGHDAFVTQLSLARQQIRTFLLEVEITTITEFEDLYLEMKQEIQEEQFCGLLYVRKVVAKRI